MTTNTQPDLLLLSCKKIKPEMFQTNIEIKTGRSSGSWGLGRSQYGKKEEKQLI